jgi:competence protein ComEC
MDFTDDPQDAAGAAQPTAEGGDGSRGLEVVMMAHHGSRSQSADLARWLAPRVTLVSVGSDNTYGHPTQDALALYAESGSALVRTDECGTAALVLRDGGLGLACARGAP